MNFYSMTIILALIVAICYLANLYVQSDGFRRDKNLLFKIYNILIDIQHTLEYIGKKIKDEHPKPTED